MGMIRLQNARTILTRTNNGGGQGAVIRRLGGTLLGVALLILAMAPAAEAVPKRIIILRHGEKHNSYKLCSVGQQRALALQSNYIGKGAPNSLFPVGSRPDGIFAVTLHCLELISPAAQSWDMPIQLFSVVPMDTQAKAQETLQLNERTREAAHAVLHSQQWSGKTVVMVWEHDHIAKKKLERQFPRERVTLRQLLNLDILPDVPEEWHGDNYDYFWIIDYGNPGSPIPTKFTVKKQKFPAPYDTVPHNDWGEPEDLPEGTDCGQ
ncbi:MAG: histidine phosphatase family protein [Syntrophobacteraceae bacterium]